MTYRLIPLRTLHKDEDIILNIKPEKQMDKLLRFKQDEREKQTLQHRFHTYYKFSFVSHDIITDDLKSKKFISTLKHLKSLKHLTIDLGDLLQIPEHKVHTIFNTIKHLKCLSVLHFQLQDLSFPLREANLQSFSEAIKEINVLLKIQVRLSVNIPIATDAEREKLIVLLENLRKLKKFTFLSVAFRLSEDFAPILQAIQILKASLSLTRFSLTFEECKLWPCVRLHDLFLVINAIKPLKCTEIFIKNCDIPDYNRLKSIFPYLEELGQSKNISITFEAYKLEMTRYEQSLFTKSVKDIRSPHKIQVQFIENYTIAQEVKFSCRQFIDRNMKPFCKVCPALICALICLPILLIVVSQSTPS